MAATDPDDSDITSLRKLIAEGGELVQIQLFFRKEAVGHKVTLVRFQDETFDDMLDGVERLLKDVNDGEH